MSETIKNPLWQRFIRVVQEEVKPALGCTEPVSLALAARLRPLNCMARWSESMPGSRPI